VIPEQYTDQVSGLDTIEVGRRYVHESTAVRFVRKKVAILQQSQHANHYATGELPPS
jgi:hypothetical protein